MDEAIEFYEKGVEIDPANAQCKTMLDKAKADKQKIDGAGFSAGQKSPFGPEALFKCMQDPECAEYFKDPSFMQTINMCM